VLGVDSLIFLSNFAFDSSLFWFTCGYSQRKIGFDQVFGFELTLLEPKDYWSKVPAKWLPFWHFYNTPIANDPEHAYSPVRILKSIATPQVWFLKHVV
jgi:hypothetical protein